MKDKRMTVFKIGTKRMRTDYLVMAAAVNIALVVAGCGSGDSEPSSHPDAIADTSQPQPIEFGSFIADGSNGGTQALQALLDVYARRHPNHSVVYTNLNFRDVPGDVAARIAQGHAPDVIMQHAKEVPAFLEKNGPNSLYPLNEFLTSPPEADILPSMYAEVVADATIDGKIYGLPTSIVTLNTLAYSKILFAAHQLNPPTTLDELLTVCETLKAAGVTPLLVLGTTYLLQDLAAAVMGIDAYADFITGGAPDEAMLRKVIKVFGEVMDKYVFSSENFGDLSGMISGKYAMYVSADWAEGALVDQGWTPGVDFGITVAPGNQGLSTYGLEVTTVLAGTSHLRESLNFIDSVGSFEGQTGYEKFGRQVSVRKDISPSEFSSERQVIVEATKQAKRRIGVNHAVIWDKAIASFMQSTPHDEEALLQAMVTIR